jgi:hypothetical protein
MLLFLVLFSNLLLFTAGQKASWSFIKGTVQNNLYSNVKNKYGKNYPHVNKWDANSCCCAHYVDILCIS